MKKMRVRLTFIDDILGTASSDPDIHGTYISSKAPDAKTKTEEIEALGEEEVKEKGRTIFPKNADGKPVLWNYQIRGFFKSAAQALNGIDPANRLPSCKSRIDQLIFVYEDADNIAKRDIVIHTDDPITDCQRPLRAETMQGARVAIADSDCIKAGAWVEFDIVILGGAGQTEKSHVSEKKMVELVKAWLDYGKYCGIGQWRNSGKGAFLWEEIA